MLSQLVRRAGSNPVLMPKRPKSANPEKGAAREKAPEKVASESTLQRVRSGPRKIRKRGANDAVHNATASEAKRVDAETVNRMSATGSRETHRHWPKGHRRTTRKSVRTRSRTSRARNAQTRPAMRRPRTLRNARWVR